MSIIEGVGDLLLNAAQYIYSLTSGILGGEENAPDILKEEESENAVQ